MPDASWAYGLHRRLHANFPAFTFDEATADAWVEWVEDLGDWQAEVAAAARSLLGANPDRLPNGPEVRRRFMADAGLLAPSWPVAHRLIGDGVTDWASLPGPVRVLRAEDARADWLKPVEERYLAEAEAHDRRVLAPGGLAELVAAGEWIDAAQRLVELRPMARRCQFDLGVPMLDGMSAEQAEEVVSAWKAENPDETLALPLAVVDADEHWEPHHTVNAALANLRLVRRLNGGAA